MTEVLSVIVEIVVLIFAIRAAFLNIERKECERKERKNDDKNNFD